MADIRQWFTDPKLLGKAFGGPSWAVWRALYAGFDGLPLDAHEAAIFRKHTGREPPDAPLDELWSIKGRRGGGSITASGRAVVIAATFKARGRLAAGEVATLPIITTDRKQSRTIKRYISGLLGSSPMLKKLVVNETMESIELSTRVIIEVHTANFRSIRGYTLIAAVLDEVAFWQSDGANPDAEILAALRPGLGTLGGRLIALSSPYARRGVLWNTHREHFGKDSPVLVAQAPTRTLNPTFPQSTIDRALAEDESRARAEYLAEFRTDVETFVPREAVDAVVEPGGIEDPPRQGVQYFGFVDPSGGSSDSMTLAIAHREGDAGALDAIRERRPPFSPAAVVEEFSDLLARYGLREVTGDRYAGEWPRERFRDHGITYRCADRPKNDLYAAFLPLINSRQTRLLDIPRLINQLVSLERRTARGGRDSIDHPPGGHDDVVNAAAGACVLAAKPRRIWGAALDPWEEPQPELLRKVDVIAEDEWQPLGEVVDGVRDSLDDPGVTTPPASCIRELVREVEGRDAGLRIADGRLQVARARRLPDYLLEAVRDGEADGMAFLDERERNRAAERARCEAEDAEARRKADMPLHRVRRLSP